MKEKARKEALIDEALENWRQLESEMPVERLSAGARANIRVLARGKADPVLERPLGSLFVPLGRLVAAAGIPALVLAVSFGWLIGAGGAFTPENDTVSIRSHKIDGQAVFEIANGGKMHRVYKAHSARELADSELFTATSGSFSDSLEGESGVVFYRID